jgi:hypothetical protein
MRRSLRLFSSRFRCSSGETNAFLVSALLSIYLFLSFRGQQFRKGFPLPWNYVEYYLSLAVLLLVHVLIMLFRYLFRSCTISGSTSSYFSGVDCSTATSSSSTTNHSFLPAYDYSDLHYSVWIVFLVSIGMNLWVGFHLNQDDNYHYRRYLQFLRLEFDTRLGMHSPR